MHKQAQTIASYVPRALLRLIMDIHEVVLLWVKNEDKEQLTSTRNTLDTENAF